MKRRTFDPDVPLPPGGMPPQFSEPELLCETCQRATPREVLVNCGARCGPCFDAYCRGAFAGQPTKPVSLEEAARKLAQFAGRS